jgi:tellurite resistance protein TehA-like permease
MTTTAAPVAQSPSQSPAGSWLAILHPAYFGMVMATGIVSIASHLTGFSLIAKTLVWLNALFYIVLWILLITRFIRYPARLLADLLNHGRCVGFFTIVAATCIVGSQALIIIGNTTVAVSLWVLGIVLWIVITYTIFTALTIKPTKPTLAEGINGGWLLAVVAAQ